jgi:nitrate reductase assembly molybdenum cofactor insertion protein NarJ
MMAQELLTARAREVMLASVLAAYPSEELEQIVRSLDDSVLERAGARSLRAVLDGPEGLPSLRSQYIELFDRGGQRASLYETEYGRMRGMSKGRDLADIAGFYRAFGMTLEEECHEMLDHLAVELEFYAVLLLKQVALIRVEDAEGVAIVEDARRKFLSSHLGALAGAVAERGEVAADAVYASVFGRCGQIIAEECSLLGVKTAPLDFFTDEEIKQDMKCGATHLPVVR